MGKRKFIKCSKSHDQDGRLENLQQMTKLTEDLCFYKQIDPMGFSTPVTGAMYMNMTIISKHHFI